MIFASTKAVACPYKYPEAIQKALDWLKDKDLASMEVGTYEIEGRDIYAMVQEVTTQPFEKRRAEKHELYLDIMFPIPVPRRFWRIRKERMHASIRIWKMKPSLM